MQGAKGRTKAGDSNLVECSLKLLRLFLELRPLYTHNLCEELIFETLLGGDEVDQRTLEQIGPIYRATVRRGYGC